MSFWLCKLLHYLSSLVSVFLAAQAPALLGLQHGRLRAMPPGFAIQHASGCAIGVLNTLLLLPCAVVVRPACTLHAHSFHPMLRCADMHAADMQPHCTDMHPAVMHFPVLTCALLTCTLQPLRTGSTNTRRLITGGELRDRAQQGHSHSFSSVLAMLCQSGASVWCHCVMCKPEWGISGSESQLLSLSFL